jgi:hypothetical protein
MSFNLSSASKSNLFGFNKNTTIQPKFKPAMKLNNNSSVNPNNNPALELNTKPNVELSRSIDPDIHKYNTFLSQLKKVPYFRMKGKINFDTKKIEGENVDITADIDIRVKIELKNSVLDINPLKTNLLLTFNKTDVELSPNEETKNFTFNLGNFGTFELSDDFNQGKFYSMYSGKFVFGNEKNRMPKDRMSEIKKIGSKKSFTFKNLEATYEKGYNQKVADETIEFLQNNKKSISLGFKKTIQNSLKEAQIKHAEHVKTYEFSTLPYDLGF